jgi:hypothetical protein
MNRPRPEEEAAVADWLTRNRVTRMPKRSATGPSIKKIREALKAGASITFERGRSGRTITFRKPGTTGAEIPVHDEGGERLRRRRKRRSPNRNGTLP